MMRFHPSVLGLAAYGILLGCSLSALVLPRASMAQTTPAHTCVAQERAVGGIIKLSNDDCDYEVDLVGRRTDGDDCTDVSESLAVGEDWSTNADALPAKICIEYSRLSRQNKAGYQACSSISDSLMDCGTNKSGIIVVVPLALAQTRFVLSDVPLEFDEGGSKIFKVKLDSQPFADTAVTLAKTNPDITLSPTTLTFTTSNWSTQQNVSVSAIRDEDSVDDSDTITLSTADGFIPFVTVAVDVDDLDITPTGNMVVSATSLALVEDRSQNFTIRLDTRPDANVFVALSSTNFKIILPSKLTFTTSNWMQDQTVNVGARPDADSADESGTITLAASGGIVAPNATIAVSIEDDNTNTKAAHVCINTLTVGSGRYIGNTGLENGNTIYPCGRHRQLKASGYRTRYIRNQRSCAPFNIDSLEPGLYYTFDLPSKVCVEDKDDLTQTAIGYRGCDSVSITDCGNGFDIVKPLPRGTLVLSLTGTLTINEGDTGTLGVRLGVEPLGVRLGNDNEKIGDITVTLSNTNSDITLSKSSLTFTNSNWKTVQNVTVTTVRDNDTSDASDTITLVASSGISAPNATLAVTVNDTTPKAGTIVTNPAGTLTIDEGKTETFGVTLGVEPQSDVTVTLAKTNDEVTLSKSSLTFTDANWNRAQNISVTTVSDNDTDDDSDTVTLSATGGIVASDTTLAIVVNDTTPTGTIVTDPAGTLTIDEGETETFGVTLGVKPQSDVTVTLAKTNDEVTLSKTSLTFTDSNWNMAQNISVTTVSDNDTDDDSDTVTLSATGGLIAPNTTLAIVVDDTTPTGKIVTNPAGTLTIEEGETETFGVTLEVKPQSDVTVTLAKTNAEVTLSKTSLTFTDTNWNEAQNVSVGTVSDLDTDDDSDTVTLSATGGLIAPNTTLAIVVDDTTPTGKIVTNPAGTLTIEEGETETFGVTLEVKPQSDVTVTLAKTNAEVTLSKTSLTFTDTNWNEAQNVSVGTVSDLDTDDDSDTVTLSATGGLIAPNTTLAIVIDDTTPTGRIITSPAGTLTIEEGETGTFGVTLEVKPQSDVTVTLAKTNAEVTLSKTSLTFTDSNWNEAQNVSVGTVSDLDTDDDSDTVTLSATGGIIASDTTLAIVIDDTTPTGKILTSPAGTLTIEEGETGTFGVTLEVKPQSDVTVTLAKTNAEVTLSKTSLTFTDKNWNEAQNVSVGTVLDGDTDDDSDTVTLSATGGIIASDTTLAIVIDDTTPTGRILTSPAGTLTIEEGETGIFGVTLEVKPQRNVSVTLTKTNAEITLSKTSLAFNDTNWNRAQNISVRTVSDNDTDDDSDTVTLSATGGIIAPDTTLAIVVDDTTPTGRIVTSPSGRLTIKEGETGRFGVRLGVKPQTNVSITLAKTNPRITLSRSSLTFTDANWSRAQNISVVTVSDNDTDNDSDTVTLSATGGIVAPDTTLAIVVDDTTPTGRIITSPTDLFSVNEGGAGTFGVRLGVQPQSNVTVTLSKTNPDITLSDTSLTFTPSNWNTAQNVLVNADQDSDTTDDFDTITLVADGGISAPNTRLRVQVSDIPAGAILVAPAGIVTVNEGGSTSIDVRLGVGVQPSADIIITLSKSNPDITLSDSSLTFTPSNWQEERRITILAAQDGDTANDSDTIVLTAAGIDTPNTTKGVSVIDDDRLGSFSLAPADRLFVVEGQEESLGIELGAMPSVPEITVTLTNVNPGVTLLPSSLTFTDSDWFTRQSVSVRAQKDDDANDGSDTITLTASGGGNYEGLSADLSVITIDTPGELAISPEIIEVVEGEAAVSFEVGLEVEPVDTDIVVISMSYTNTDITLFPSSLVFAKNEWRTPQRVQIEAAEDTNEDDEGDAVTLTAVGGNYDRTTGSITVSIEDNDDEEELGNGFPGGVKAYALAIPPDTATDRSQMRIRCKQDTACAVYLDCSSQDDGTVFDGWIPEPIPAWGARRFVAADIVRHTGGSWSGKGRLGCALRSEQAISAQIWTRSGDGVLVNNSAALRSVLEDERYRADIESIPSPDASDESNIRIRCLAPVDTHCFDTRFFCFDDRGTEYAGELGTIGRLNTRHLQAQTLAEIIDHRWEGIGLSCELRSRQPFTVQVLTRTGGGGALVNNSATGSVRPPSAPAPEQMESTGSISESKARTITLGR